MLTKKNQTLKAKAYNKIVDLLNTQALQSGQVVTQRDLVEATGTTLAAVREAIPRLEADGLIVALNQRGLMVPNIDVTFLRNACQLREIIEQEAIQCTEQHIPVSTIQEWEHEHLYMLEQVANNPTDELIKEVQHIDASMHENLVASLSNDMISNIYRVNSIKVRMAAQERLLVTPQNAVRVLGEHLAVLAALKERRTADASAAMRHHLNNSLQLALGGHIERKQRTG